MSSLIEAAGDHLWQSTLILLLAAGLTLAFRRHRAHVRYWIWFMASAKFLVPYAAVVALGRTSGARPVPGFAEPEVALVIDAVSRPFSRSELASTVPSPPVPSGLPAALPEVLLFAWCCGCVVLLVTRCARWRRAREMARSGLPVTFGRELDSLRRLQNIHGCPQPVRLVLTTSLLEPGVFGIIEPVLLWPQHMTACLSDGELDALVAHELAHVRRRDNLLASLHMLVQAVFWCHPLVWWLGARLLDERERACDEEVIRLGADPRVYAESIVKTCRFCLESPLPTLVGVAGSHVKRRIELIMSDHRPSRLNGWRTVLLAAVGAAAVAGPVALGVMTAPSLNAQTPAGDPLPLEFAAASVTPTGPDRLFHRHTISADGRFAWKHVTLSMLVRTAYRGERFDVVSGMPAWARSDHFDVEATGKEGSTEEQVWSMVRRLLADRFQLRARIDTRELPVYALVTSRGDESLGPRIRPSACAAKDTVAVPPGPLDPRNPIPLPCGGIRTTKGTLQARFATMAKLADALSMHVGRPVRDRTGLTGAFDFEAEWTPATESPEPLAPGIGPATMAAIEEQLALRLDAETGPVRVLVIEHAERLARDELR